MDIVRRDHPELPGIVTELKLTIREMKEVNLTRKEAFTRKFKNAINDSTIFLDLLRTYGSVLCFYLQLKSRGRLQRKHTIFSRMLQLRRRVATMRGIYQNTMKTMRNLPKSYDSQKFLIKEKSEIESIKRKNEKEKLAHQEKEYLKKRDRLRALNRGKQLKENEQKIVEEYVRKEERRMNNWQMQNSNSEVDKDDKRRHINMKIFKSIGLKRYRKKSIPRIRKKLKYQKALKLRKLQGYKPYKGKMAHYDSYDIPIRITHSKKLDAQRPKNF